MPDKDEAVTRLFVAVWPSEPAREHVRSLARDGWVNVRWTPEDNWHVTLAFLGEAEIDDVAHRLDAGEYPAASQRPSAVSPWCIRYKGKISYG